MQTPQGFPGVWVRRTSTVAWTLAGVLSGFAAILAAGGGQSLALTQVLSPDLLLLALTGALVGAMTSLPVSFIACVAVGIIYELLQWNLTNPSNRDRHTELRDVRDPARRPARAGGSAQDRSSFARDVHLETQHVCVQAHLLRRAARLALEGSE